MISVHLQVAEFHDRMDSALRLIDETHKAIPGPGGSTLPGPVSREARGLAVVLLFAAYEHLMKSLTQTLLEGAVRCRVGNRRLKPGFRVFAMKGTAQSIRDRNPKDMYTKILPDLVAAAGGGGRTCTINTNAFPDDGSFMKSSQIELWCRLFDVGHPAPIIHRSWTRVDSIVSQRNDIAHGLRTPDVVGRNYTESEIRALIDDWRDDWVDFLNHIGALASTRDFFRTP